MKAPAKTRLKNVPIKYRLIVKEILEDNPSVNAKQVIILYYFFIEAPIINLFDWTRSHMSHF